MRFLLLFLPLISAVAWAEPEVRETRHNDWTEVCISDQGATRCEAIQVLSVNQGNQSQPILRVTVSQVNDQPFIEFALPLGMDLRSGMVVQIDQGEELRFGYSTCVPQGCAGVLQLSAPGFPALWF
jgi:invasion protein IalB